MAYNTYQSLGRLLRKAKADLKGARGKRRTELREHINQLEHHIEQVR